MERLSTTTRLGFSTLLPVLAVILLLLLWAGTRSAVCAATVSACSTGTRILLASIGGVVVICLAAATWILAGAVNHSGSIPQAIMRIGTGLVSGLGIVFALAALFSSGFALTW
ncbi:hypothetical protein [Salinibacterium sp. ZJ450]|uniref:hypothetical protein n=1 Tax=Salinibacterium sp. ZJ450 TaxID=2708338 RepID=UPI0014213468|nr:hypothetical protein [Salinibacterium sp. ZJ450]